MAAQVLTDLEIQVAQNVEVEGSAADLIDGFVARQQAAVDKALELGATAEELAPLTDLNAALKASKERLAAAVAENTDAA